MEETRTGSDLLLEIEAKLNTLLEMVSAQNLNINVLSNKLNVLLKSQNVQLNSQVAKINKPSPSIEAVDNSKIQINSDNNLQVEQSPNGFRRTSRSDTYTNPPALPKVQPKSEIIVPTQNEDVQFVDFENQVAVNLVPTIQKVSDKNNKAVVLAAVEIINIANDTKQLTKTNSVGKWSASLEPGDYKVSIKKRDLSTRQIVEIVQDIKVSGAIAPYNLPSLIFK